MLYDLFSDFFDDDFSLFMHSPKQVYVQNPKTVCKNCRTSLAEFINTGKLGCSECYKAFEPQLKEVLKSIHGNIHHVGEVPPKAAEKQKKKKELDELKKELASAIGEERFEDAAVLRDKIKELEGGEGK